MKKSLSIILFFAVFLLLLLNVLELLAYLEDDLYAMSITGYLQVYAMLLASVVFLMVIFEAFLNRNIAKLLKPLPLLFVVTYLFGFLVILYIYVDSNKIKVCINNLSPVNMTEVSVLARNRQHIKVPLIPAHSSKTVIVDCDRVTFDEADVIGLGVMYKSEGEFVYLLVAGSNDGLDGPYIEVRIVNDKMAYESHIVGADTTWYKFNDGKSYQKWSEIEKSFPGVNR